MPGGVNGNLEASSRGCGGVVAERALHDLARLEDERRGADGTGVRVKADAGRVQRGRYLLRIWQAGLLQDRA